MNLLQLMLRASGHGLEDARPSACSKGREHGARPFARESGTTGAGTASAANRASFVGHPPRRALPGRATPPVVRCLPQPPSPGFWWGCLRPSRPQAGHLNAAGRTIERNDYVLRRKQAKPPEGPWGLSCSPARDRPPDLRPPLIFADRLFELLFVQTGYLARLT